MTEAELSVGIHELVKNHVGHTINLAVDIVNYLKTKDLFVTAGVIHDIIEIDFVDGDSESDTYNVYVEPTEED